MRALSAQAAHGQAVQCFECANDDGGALSRRAPWHACCNEDGVAAEERVRTDDGDVDACEEAWWRRGWAHDGPMNHDGERQCATVGSRRWCGRCRGMLELPTDGARGRRGDGRWPYQCRRRGRCRCAARRRATGVLLRWLVLEGEERRWQRRLEVAYSGSCFRSVQGGGRRWSRRCCRGRQRESLQRWCGRWWRRRRDVAGEVGALGKLCCFTSGRVEVHGDRGSQRCLGEART